MGRGGERRGREVVQKERGEDNNGSDVRIDVFAHGREVGDGAQWGDGVEGGVVVEEVDLLVLAWIQLGREEGEKEVR